MIGLAAADAAEPIAALLDGGGPGFLIAWILWRLSRLATRAEAKLAEACDAQRRHHETMKSLLVELRAQRMPAANGHAGHDAELELVRRRLERLEQTPNAGA